MNGQYHIFVQHINMALLCHFLGGPSPLDEVRRITGHSNRRILNWIRTGQIPAHLIWQICEYLDNNLKMSRMRPVGEVGPTIEFKEFDHLTALAKQLQGFHFWLNSQVPQHETVFLTNDPTNKDNLPFEQVYELVRECINQRLFS